ncbi:hypothetical protein FHG87_019914 [Trinorchestia longiramus]|nr:hypothetical protein FHG87_019914 [Trinorchestia longiramus]
MVILQDAGSGSSSRAFVHSTTNAGQNLSQIFCCSVLVLTVLHSVLVLTVLHSVLVLTVLHSVLVLTVLHSVLVLTVLHSVLVLTVLHSVLCFHAFFALDLHGVL